MSGAAASPAAAFLPLTSCWICGADDLVAVHDLIFELSAYRDQDPDLAA